MEYQPSQKQEKHSIEELYKITRGQKDEWGIEGYRVPSENNLYLTREHAFPKSPRADSYAIAKKRATEPDPTKYTLEYKEASKMNWEKSNGKFLYSKRETVIDEVMRKSASMPGPGAFWPKPTSKKAKKPEMPTGHVALGKFSSGERLSFLTTTEFYAEETPCSWAYNPHKTEINKEHGWAKPKDKRVATEQEQKARERGPGKYSIDKPIKFVTEREPLYSFPKDHPPNAIELKGHQTKGFPGVGAYKEIDNGYKAITKKGLTARIFPYKVTRMTDAHIKSKQWVPGPGAYDWPPNKLDKKKE
ncbi:unnamed protein product [Blepharisma stoltei]|uniref:Uncharacterized protein n=1 Tax=Blepharisma stoltei TaxID=1481888 RepID=A0AAU9JPU1_9CILI|nr:unnamed protein product [Blepharisma stoltei]